MKYAILLNEQEYYKYMFQSGKKHDNVQCFSGMTDFFSPIEMTLRRIHMWLIRHLKLHLKKEIWWRIMLKKIGWSLDEPICFIYYMTFIGEIKQGMVRYIKKQCPQSKHMFYFTDPKNLNVNIINYLKEELDCVGVFDPGLAKKYHINYFPSIYPDSTETSKASFKYDICFIGNDKGRREELERIAVLCEKESISTAFYLNVDNEVGEAEKVENIHYFQGMIKYEEVLNIIKESRCVLELKVEPYNSCSLRIQEAVTLNKKIVTNNKNIYMIPVCNKNRDNIYDFDAPEDLDWNFIRDELPAKWNYENEFALNTVLNMIDKQLKKI